MQEAKRQGPRGLNRHRYTLEEAEEALQKPVVQALIKLITWRNKHKAFMGQVSCMTLSTGSDLDTVTPYILARQSPSDPSSLSYASCRTLALPAHPHTWSGLICSYLLYPLHAPPCFCNRTAHPLLPWAKCAATLSIHPVHPYPSTAWDRCRHRLVCSRVSILFCAHPQSLARPLVIAYLLHCKQS